MPQSPRNLRAKVSKSKSKSKKATPEKDYVIVYRDEVEDHGTVHHGLDAVKDVLRELFDENGDLDGYQIRELGTPIPYDAITEVKVFVRGDGEEASP